MRDDDGLALGGDWHDWGNSCDADDHTNDAVSGALSLDANCGQSCALGNVTAGNDVDFALDGAGDNIGSNAISLRLAVPFGSITGLNAIKVANGAGTHPGPRLVVLACQLPGTPTPTPTPTQLCEWVTLEAPTNGPDAQGLGETFPPGFGSCVSVGDRIAGVAFDGTAYRSSAALMSFDTASLVSSALVEDAWVRLYATAAYDDDSLGLSGDWYDWGGSCSATDLIGENVPTNALSSSGACGSACALSQFAANTTYTLQLDDPQTHIDRQGGTTLRLQVAGAPESGFNGVLFSRETPAPALLLHMCYPTPQLTPTPTPTPTSPPSDCSSTTIVATDSWLVLGAGATYPPAFGACGQLNEHILPAGKLFGDYNGDPDTYLFTESLLQWDLSDIPSGAVVGAATLQLYIGQVGGVDGYGLTGDWHAWTTCGESDYDDDPPSNALSPSGLCGSGCNLANVMTAQNHTAQYMDFPLDAVSTNIVPGATAQLRLHSNGGAPTSYDIVLFGDHLSDDPPRLVVSWCIGAPGMTPTISPTLSPTAVATGIASPTSSPEQTLPTATSTGPTSTSPPTPTETATPTPVGTLEIEIAFEHGVGDGQAATSVPVGRVASIAIDGDGNIYYVDADHHRVR
ncbi:MAG: hypothetical protein HY270_23450, partial [Deltaproteobacteria bacterium]|nr:hypothetical protein [Deltaproteobacteria bacterium]